MRSSYKPGIITGIAVGLFSISAFSFFNWLNTKNGWGIQPATIRGISGLLTILIQAIGIYFSMMATKKAQNGLITYGQAFKAGLMVAIITALITACCGLIYCTIVNPGYADYMVNEARKAMIASGKSAKQIEQDLVGVKWEFSAIGQVIQALVAQSVVGTLISLAMSAFIKNKKTV
jgi:hypothetical protein